MTDTFNIESFKPDNLDTQINKVRGHLHIALHQIDGKFDLDWHLQKIRGSLLRGEITAESVDHEYGPYILTDSGKANYKEALRFSSIYIELAELAKAKNQLSNAWSFVCKAHYEAGIMRASLSKHFVRDDDDVRQEVARRGGEKRAKSYDDDKAEVMRLIRELAPEGGWESEAACFESIKDKLRESIEKRKRVKLGDRPKLNQDNFKRTVINWLTYDQKKARTSTSQNEVYYEYEKFSTFRMTDPNNLP